MGALVDGLVARAHPRQSRLDNVSLVLELMANLGLNHRPGTRWSMVDAKGGNLLTNWSPHDDELRELNPATLTLGYRLVLQPLPPLPPLLGEPGDRVPDTVLFRPPWTWAPTLALWFQGRDGTMGP